jgi:hypothetical protein
MRKGQALTDVMFVVGVVAIVLVPLVTLSTRNAGDQREIMERALVETICLDTVERFKKYKPYWPLPGAPARPPENIQGPPLWEMYGAVDLRPDKAGFFDRVYLDQMRSLGMSPRPNMEVIQESTPGLFRLVVSVAWKSSSGRPRQVRYSRYCFAP